MGGILSKYMPLTIVRYIYITYTSTATNIGTDTLIEFGEVY